MYEDFQSDPPSRPTPEPVNPAAPQPAYRAPLPPPPIRRWSNVDFVLVVIVALIALFLIAPLTERIFDGFINDEADPLLGDVIELTGFTAAYIAMFILTVIVLALRGFRPRDIGLRDVPFRWYMIAVGLGIVFIQIFAPGSVEPVVAEETASFSAWYFLAAIEIGLMVVILAPLVEELMFRGVLHNWLRGRVGRWLAVIMSGTLFGLAHLSPMLIISNIVLGLVLSTAYEKSGSLWIPLVIHFINNFLVALMVVCLIVLLALFMA